MSINKKENMIPFAVVFASIAIIVFLIYRGEPDTEIRRVRLAGESIRVELATTPREHVQGLSGRDSLSENEGMLFVFDEPGEYLFWMKGMNFPIDIIWVDESREVIYIKKEAQPEDYMETYGPKADAKYILEVVAGFSDQNDLKVGDQVRFTY